MAYFDKKSVKWDLENMQTISASEYVSTGKRLSSVTQATNVIVTTPTSACPPGSSGSINLSALTPVNGQTSMETRLIAVSDDVDLSLYGQREQDRKVRREIANSNERRRMQSINAGFKSLKTILPHTDGEKLSKAAILQQTADYIVHLENDKLKLLDQNDKLRCFVDKCKCNSPKHRALLGDLTDKDEGIGSPREEDMEDIRKDAIEVRQQLEKERRMRMVLEDKVRLLEAQIYPKQLRELTQAMKEPIRKNTVKRAKVDSISSPQNITSPVASLPASNIPESIQILSPKLDLSDVNLGVFHKDENKSVCPNSHSQFQAYQSVPQLSQPSLNVLPEVAPSPALCVTIAQENETASSPSPPVQPVLTVQNKTSVSVPRSRQPLKKRAIEMTRATESCSPLTKIPKVQVGVTLQVPDTGMTTVKPIVASPQPHTVATVLPAQAVYSVNPPSGISTSALTSPVTMQSRPLHPAIPLQQVITPCSQEIAHLSPTVLATPQHVTIASTAVNQLLLTTAHSATRTFMTLTPAYSTNEPMWPEHQRIASTPQGCQVSVAAGNPDDKPLNTLPPTLQRLQRKANEITLNQLNSVPSASMTLTQLNAHPTMSRLSAATLCGNVSLPCGRVQTQYLPLVPIDKVLGVRGERRISTTTTDSTTTVSDEESKCEMMEECNQQINQVSTAKVSGRSASDPCQSASYDSPGKVVKPDVKHSLSNSATLSVLSDGPGSPPVIRHIDAVATRRNLETIVQAIDHLEQQERRNSQDQQPSNDNEQSQTGLPR